MTLSSLRRISRPWSSCSMSLPMLMFSRRSWAAWCSSPGQVQVTALSVSVTVNDNTHFATIDLSLRCQGAQKIFTNEEMALCHREYLRMCQKNKAKATERSRRANLQAWGEINHPQIDLSFCKPGWPAIHSPEESTAEPGPHEEIL